MTIIDTLKAASIEAADKRWEEAIAGARRFFRYDNPHGLAEPNAEHDAKVRELAHALLSTRDLYSVLGGMEDSFRLKMNGYPGYSYGPPVSRLEFIRFFIGHEILDDGEPGVGYYRSTIGDEKQTSDMFARCGPDHPRAQPYFHRSIDLLRQDYPDAEWLSLDRALEILAFHKAEQPKRVTSHRLWQRFLGSGSEEEQDKEIDYLTNGSEEDQQMLALADALAQET